MRLPDGTIVNSYFGSNGGNSSEDIYDSGIRILQGQVEKIHYVDEKSNQSKQFIEYDVSVKDAYGGQTVYQNVRKLTLTFSTNDYDETILEPNLHAFENKLEESNIIDNKNGTYVLVGFIQGSIEKPFILGALQHPRQFEEDERIWHKPAKKEDGIRKLGEFRGFQYEIDKEGQVTFTYRGERNDDGTFKRPDTAPTKILINKTGKFLIFDKEKQLIEIDRVAKTIAIQQYNDLIKTEKGIDSNPKEDPTNNIINSIVMDKAAKKITTITGKDTNIIENDGTNEKITLTFKSGLTVTFNGSGDNFNFVTNKGTKIDILGSSDEIKILTNGGAKVEIAGSGDTILAQTNAGDKVNISPGVIEVKENGGGTMKLASGKVAIGNGTEVVDILSKTLDFLANDLANLGYPLANSPQYASLKVLLDAIKGTL